MQTPLIPGTQGPASQAVNRAAGVTWKRLVFTRLAHVHR